MEVALGDALRPLFQRHRVSAAGDNRIAAAAAALDHRFTCPTLLAEALIHPSAQLRGASYERLEFLGDRVLGLVVAEMLYAAFPAEAEGALAKRFTALVRRETLTRIAADLDLGAFLRLSRGEEESGGRANPAVLADALEAVIGALFLDGGFAAAETFVRRHWSAPMAATDRPPEDAKSRLQEWAQGHGLALPVYTTVSSRGPSHSPTFEVEVRVEDQPPARATGATKRAAEQAAAAGLLAQMAGLKRRRPE